MRLKFFFLVVFIMICTLSLSAEDGKIRIAIMEFQGRGEARPDEVAVFSDFIRGKIVETNVFEVVERSQIDRLLEEQNIQLSGIVDDQNSEEIIEFGRFSAVKMVLIGSVGRLYGQVIISLRLVNAETGEIIFANTLYAPQDEIFGEIKLLASKIADNGLASRTEVTLEDIDTAMKEKQYRRAYTRINQYMRTSDVTAEINDKKREIEVSLAKSNASDARKALRREYHRESLDLINEAIILNPQEEYYRLRDKILEDEKEYLRKEELRLTRLEQRQQEEDARAAAGYRSLGERIGSYYSGLSPRGYHLGAAAGAGISEANEIDSFPESYGLHFRYQGVRSRQTDTVFSSWYISTAALYDSEESTGGNSVDLSLAIAPLTGIAVKLGNIILNLGADGGVFATITDAVDQGYRTGLSAGLLGGIDFKLLKTFGGYLELKADYRWTLDPDYDSGLAGYAACGLTF